MINLSLENKQLKISFTNKSYSTFNQIVSILRKEKFRFQSENKSWYAPAYKYDTIKDALGDIDIIEDKVDQNEYSNIIIGNPEMELIIPQRDPDYSLMNFPPMKGKHPYENFQDDGIKKCINRSRYAAFWQMGLGKSYVVAAIIAHRLYKYHDAKKVLFLTTSIGVRNLKHELIKFIKDLDESKIAIGSKDNREPFKDDVDIVIASYNSFRLICDHYKKTLKIKSKSPRKPFLPLKEWSKGEELILICDESHEVMYNTSQRGYLVALHSQLFKYRYLFSGTPADSPEKLYNQFYILDPWLVYNLSYAQWKDKMAYLGNYFSASAITGWKKDELEKSNKRFLRAHGNYYETKDLIDLPDYNEKKIYLPMTPYHRELYEALVTEDIKNQQDNGTASTRDLINRWPFMMLGVNNPSLLKKHEERFSPHLTSLIENFKPSSLEKLNALEDIISDYPDEKIIVWAIHPDSIKMIADKFKKLNPICIDGSVKQEERFELVRKFDEEKEHRLLVSNIQVLNTSITILNAHIQVYMELDYSYSSYIQSTRRIYRYGQQENVLSFILLYDRSLDTFIWKTLTSKNKLTKGLVDKKFISASEWQQIFNCEESTNFDNYLNIEN